MTRILLSDCPVAFFESQPPPGHLHSVRTIAEWWMSRTPEQRGNFLVERIQGEDDSRVTAALWSEQAPVRKELK